MNRVQRLKIDQLGIITSGLCAVHCMAIPVLLSIGAIGGFGHQDHALFEWLVIALSSFFGMWSIYNGLRGHGKLYPQLLIAFGALIIVFGLSFVTMGHGIMAVGGLMLVIGHWFNWRQLSFQK